MRPSLTRRLLTLYLATIFVVVGTAGGLVWVMMRRALHAGLDETLRTEALALASRLEVDEGRIEFERGPSQPESAEPAEPLVRIVDERGGRVFSSSVLTNDRTAIALLSGVSPAASPLWHTTPLPPKGSMSRILALHILVPPEDEHTGNRDEPATLGAWVLVARSLDPIGHTLGQLASVLASAVGAAMLVALAGGLILARRGTQPVRALAESVGRVNPADPELSLNHGQVPVELEPIVKTTERLLERVRGELSRQRQLTADVAHDLRTPVAGVRTLLDVCLQRERSSHEYVAAIEKARAALRQLSGLLDHVLTLSRLDANVDQPAFEEVLLDDALSAAVATVQPLAAAREIAIQTETGPRIELRTDREKLAKILSNLIGNAVEHSPPGDTVRVAAHLDGTWLEVSVADRGPGVPSSIRGRIFDRFVRGDSARAGGDGHHGLGLPIAAGLARLLGGEVSLDERHEPGSRFVVRLPLVE